MTNTGSRFSPENLEDVLEEAATLGKKIFITEFGSDVLQSEYYRKTLHIISQALSRGLPVEKAFAWSIRTNFEWNLGENADFGLCDSAFNNKPVVDEVIKPVFLKHKLQQLAQQKVTKSPKTVKA
jgi:beta-glucosidase/6-phospho-beta-glucosidase/beta-galactosidase